jgi:hypothetical protein
VTQHSLTQLKIKTGSEKSLHIGQRHNALTTVNLHFHYFADTIKRFIPSGDWHDFTFDWTSTRLLEQNTLFLDHGL